MVQLKLKTINACDMLNDNRSSGKHHGSSVGKLQSSPGNKISKVNLETSTSNPSINIVPVV